MSLCNEHRKLHALQRLEIVHQELFGCVLDLEARCELPDNVEWRSTGNLRKSVREVNYQYSPLSAMETKGAMSGTTNTLNNVISLTEKLSVV